MNYAHITMAVAAGFLIGMLFVLWVWKVPPGDDD